MKVDYLVIVSGKVKCMSTSFVTQASIIRESTFASMEGSGGVDTRLYLRDEELRLLFYCTLFSRTPLHLGQTRSNSLSCITNELDRLDIFMTNILLR